MVVPARIDDQGRGKEGIRVEEETYPWDQKIRR